jgi:hypothetical protein
LNAAGQLQAEEARRKRLSRRRRASRPRVFVGDTALIIYGYHGINR